MYFFAFRLGESAHADCECELSVLSATAKRAAAVPKHYPSTSTIRQLLSTCCDIRAVPKKVWLFFKRILSFE